MKKNRYLSCLVLAVFMICSVFVSVPQGYAASQFSDIQNHWAADQIKTMVDQGITTGYPDNTFRPDKQVTRAEFVTLVNKTFQFTTTADINYPDVKTSDWFAPEIAKAKSAGYLSGYADGTIKPKNNLSLQEAAVIIAQAAKLASGSDQELAKFTDAASIPAWSKGSVAALVSKAYIGGYPDGTFKPTKTITRAEAVVILAKAKAPAAVTPTQPATPTVDITKLDKAGSYGPATGNQAVSGNVTISAAGVTLQNETISGDLLISEGVGNGDVSLKNITVKGTTTIKGGGPNTVKIDNCVLNRAVVNKSNGSIRLLLSGKTTISELVADSAVKVDGQATITKATINKTGVVIEAKPGSITVASGISAIVAGKTETGPASTTSGGGGSGNGSNSGSTTNAIYVNYYTSTNIGDIVTLKGSTVGAVYTVKVFTSNSSTTPLKQVNVVNGFFAMDPFYTQSASFILKGYNSADAELTSIIVNKSSLATSVPALTGTVVVNNTTSTNITGIITLKGAVTGDVALVKAFTAASNTNAIKEASVSYNSFTMTAFYTQDASITVKGYSSGGQLLCTTSVVLANLATSTGNVVPTGTVSVNNSTSTNIGGIITLKGTTTGDVTKVKAFTAASGTSAIKEATVAAGSFSMAEFFTQDTSITVKGYSANGTLLQTISVVIANLATSTGGGNTNPVHTGTVTVNTATSTNVNNLVTLKGTTTGDVTVVKAYTSSNPTTPVATGAVTSGQFSLTGFTTTDASITVKGEDAAGTVLNTCTVQKSELLVPAPSTVITVTQKRKVNVPGLGAIYRIDGTVTGAATEIEAVSGTQSVGSTTVSSGSFQVDLTGVTATSVTLKAKAADSSLLTSLDVSLVGL